MKIQVKVVVLVAVFAMVQLLQGGMAHVVKADPITGLFNTGVNAGGTPLANGFSEIHYKITSSPLGTPTPLIRTSAGGFPIGPWNGDSTTSAWIVPNFATDGGGLLNHPAGMYTYELAFDLTGLIPSTASITGMWATDNSGSIYLNGSATGSTAAGFNPFTGFSINSGFTSGANTLAFMVTNDVQATGNPTGLRVDYTSATADPIRDAEPIPEPATCALFGIGLVGLAGGAARRKFKKKELVKH